ncbi:hypothetical protein [Desmospora activa]|uniref:Uncharacterized protein n=1 Tax=Desmospora activa DSM 45169 TaxID=1121389 RepID=A0A2T4ZBY1_9BACL|nr:hypothetical protein [Desmospora activa]PTM59387.1 hypothetical protein C8J48_2004 [Desmospora activa DSM 45169]
MNEEQMLDKYAGIMQYQLTLNPTDTDKLLADLIPLLALSFERSAYECACNKAKEENTVSIYYAKSRKDPRCLVLIQFLMSFFCHVIIRFPQTDEQVIRARINEVSHEDLYDTLTQQSKMNRIVHHYQIDIEVIDEYDLWKTVFKQKNFWNEYARFTSDNEVKDEEALIYPALAKPIYFEIEPKIGLLVDIGDKIFQSMLLFKHPSLDHPYRLGWDDAAHWRPHVLRWAEFKPLIYFLTIRYPDHFVVPFLLLLRFAPITKEEDEGEISKMIKAAWRSLHLFREEEIEQLDRIATYKPHFTWSYEAETGRYHACDAPMDIYSKRHICTDDFPFHAFADLFRSIESYKNTAAWYEAEEKWIRLIAQYGMEGDETWLARRNQ